jgi:hypothetical protein
METTHTHTCVNCGYRNRIKVALFNADKPPARRSYQSGTFHSTAHWDDEPPTGPGWWTGLKSFVYVMRGRPLRYRPPTTHIRVSSEVKTSRTQMLMNEMDIPLSDRQASELAHCYLSLGLQWSRANTVDNTSLSQPQHNTIHKAFQNLNFVSQVNSRRYDLTNAGYRFLRHFNPTPPPTHQAHIDYERGTANKHIQPTKPNKQHNNRE